MVGHLAQEDRDGEAEREREGPRGLGGPWAEAGDGTGLEGRHAEGIFEVFRPLQGRPLLLGAVAEKELNDAGIPLAGCGLEWPAKQSGLVHIGAMIEKQPHHPLVPVRARYEQRSGSAALGLVHVGAAV